MSGYQVSDDTRKKIEAFEQADKLFKDEWAQFEALYTTHLERLDMLREDRNAKLDDATRTLRAEAIDISITKIRSITAGPFTAQKKFQKYYSLARTIVLLREKNLWDSAVAEGMVKEKIELEKFDALEQFLKRHGVERDFEECEDGIEMSPAIYSPKPVPPFGVELKEKK